MDAELLDIQQTLANIALQREAERLAAHEKAMSDLAEASKREAERQAKAIEEQRVAQEKVRKRKEAAQAAETDRLREEAELRRLVEQEENRKQEELDNTVRLREDIRKKLDAMEHAEEMAKKALRDAMLQAEPKVDTERIMPNPLDRFFQPQE